MGKASGPDLPHHRCPVNVSFLIPLLESKNFGEISWKEGRFLHSYTSRLGRASAINNCAWEFWAFIPSPSWVISRDFGGGERPRQQLSKHSMGSWKQSLSRHPCWGPWSVRSRSPPFQTGCWCLVPDETLRCVFLLGSWPSPWSWKERKMTGNSLMLHSLSPEGSYFYK
jgi:hypothetical protein